MKVARLSRDMRIRCSDPEFRALRLLVEVGLENLDSERLAAESKPVRRHLNSQRFRRDGGPLAIDLDSRKPRA